MTLLFSIILTMISAIIPAGNEPAPAEKEKLSTMWEELRAPQFPEAVERSEGVCIIPMGVLEKHGPQLPLGTDAITAHEVSVLASQKEYVVVFPFYYVGQINEARHQPGTIAYSPELLYMMLDETCKEVARNGFKKIILYNIHGGSTDFLSYFCMAQLHERKDYVVYAAEHQRSDETNKYVRDNVVVKNGQHADEIETATMMYLRGDLVDLSAANSQSAEDQDRLKTPGVRPGIWWYAKYPNHYAGNASNANFKLGEVIVNDRIDELVRMIKDVKADKAGPALQEEFFDRADNPLGK